MVPSQEYCPKTLTDSLVRQNNDFYLLTNEMRIFLDTHDGRKVERSFIQGLTEIRDKLDGKDTTIDLPKDAFIGSCVNLNGSIAKVAARLLISLANMLDGHGLYLDRLLVVAHRRGFQLFGWRHDEIALGLKMCAMARVV